MRKLALPLALTVILSVVAVMWVQRATLTAAPAAAEAAAVDSLLRLEFYILAVFFVLCMVFFLYSLWAFRRREGDTGEGTHFHSHTGLEIAWTVVPVIIVVAMGYHGARVIADLKAVDVAKSDGDLEVIVTGQQWSWTFEYPEQGVATTDLVLPSGQPVYFRLRAVDVIHSFWVPEFRLKMDTIPGKENVLRLTPNEVGDFKVRCAELCGTRHAYMETPVRVLETADFQAWMDEEIKIANDPTKAGPKVAAQFGCIGCHSIDGSKLVGPTWQGLVGHEVPLADGSSVTADDAYLLQSIIDPSAAIVEGYADNVMPRDFANRMTEKQINDVIAYIKTLK